MNPFAHAQEVHGAAMMAMGMGMAGMMMGAAPGGVGGAAGAGQEQIFPKPPPAAVVNNLHNLQQHQAVPSPIADPKLSGNVEGSNNAATLAQNNDEEESAEDAEERLARSRERNREHARRTRLRKKAQLRALQDRVKVLQEEGRILRQTVEECSIASILLGLQFGSAGDAADVPNDAAATAGSSAAPQSSTINFDPTGSAAGAGGKRKRFLLDSSDQAKTRPMKLRIRGVVTTIGGEDGKAHINWKTGVYCDEEGVHRQLSSEELETLRRERNRMHAKMTRDRKKSFISAVEKTIHDLERENSRMRDVLAKQAKRHFPSAGAAGAVVGAAGAVGEQVVQKREQPQPVNDAGAAVVTAVSTAAAMTTTPVITPGSTPLLAAAVSPSPGRVSPAGRMTQPAMMMLQPAPALPVGVPLRLAEEHKPLTVAPVAPVANPLAAAPSTASSPSLKAVTTVVPLSEIQHGTKMSAPPAIHGFSVVG